MSCETKTFLIVCLFQIGCADLHPPRVLIVKTPVPTPAGSIATGPVTQRPSTEPVNLPPPDPASNPVARESDATVFRANVPTRAEALKQVTAAVRRHVQSELELLARREAAWCRDNLAFTREQLFFSQLSIATHELGGKVLVEEYLTVDTQSLGGYQLAASLPKTLPARLLHEHLRGLEPYVATSARAGFRERFSIP